MNGWAAILLVLRTAASLQVVHWLQKSDALKAASADALSEVVTIEK